MLFAEKDGTQSASQIMAFEDTWEWKAKDEFSYFHERGVRLVIDELA